MKDPYLYQNTEILINKFNIRDNDELNSLEADFTSSRLKDNSDYVRNALVTVTAIFHDLGDKSNPKYLIRIIKDAIKRGKND